MREVVGLVFVGVLLLTCMVACGSGQSEGEDGKEISLFNGASTPTLGVVSESEGATRDSEDAGAIALAPELFLDVLAPEDETVVDAPEIEVAGNTLPEAMVSVNGKPASVDATGAFVVLVTLDQGPNSLKVIAGAADGTQVSRVVSVVYMLPYAYHP